MIHHPDRLTSIRTDGAEGTQSWIIVTTAADHGVVIRSLKAANEREGPEGSTLRMSDRAVSGGGRGVVFKRVSGQETGAGAHQSFHCRCCPRPRKRSDRR